MINDDVRILLIDYIR